MYPGKQEAGCSDRPVRPSGAGVNRYQLRQRLATLGADFWITNYDGDKVFRVDARVLSMRQMLVFEDDCGHEMARIHAHILQTTDRMEIESPDGVQLAMVRKAQLAPLRDRWVVRFKGGPDLEVRGNLLDHEYTIGEGCGRVAEISKKWFYLRDSYGVAVAPGQDDLVVLAAAICIDEMAHSGR